MRTLIRTMAGIVALVVALAAPAMADEVRPNFRDQRAVLDPGADLRQVAKISYRTGRIVRTVPVGDHPQRVLNGVIRTDLAARLPD